MLTIGRSRLYFSAGETSGELARLVSFCYSGTRYACPVITSRTQFREMVLAHLDYGNIIFELEADVDTLQALNTFFMNDQKVMWTLETPAVVKHKHWAPPTPALEWAFDGYVASVETTCALTRRAKVELRIVGPMTCYTESKGYVDTTPVFNRKAHKLQAANLADMLARVTLTNAKALNNQLQELDEDYV